MFYSLLTTYYLLFALLTWRKINWAMLFVIATLPSYLIRFHVGPVPTTLLEGMVLIVVAIWLIQRFQVSGFRFQKSNKLLITNYQLPLLIFLLAVTISMFTAPDLRAAAGIWKAYFVEPVLFFIVLLDLMHNSPQPSLNLREGDRVFPPLKVRWGLPTGKAGRGSYGSKISPQQIVTALSITALVLSLYAIMQRFTGLGIPPPWDKELRVTSIFPYPNALALFLAPLVPLFVARLLTLFRHSERSEESRANARRRILEIGYWILVIAAALAAIIFAQSTGALIGVASGLIVMGLVVLRGKAHDRELFHARRFSTRITIAVLAALAVFTVLAQPSLRDELLLRNWSGHVRRTQWAETVEMLRDRPILGAGLAGYKETLAPYHKATYLEIFEYPHNIVLNFWSETGLLGVLAFAWLIIVFFRNSPPLKIRGDGGSYEPIAIAAMASMVTLLIHGLVDVPYFKNDLAMLFWIIFALGLTPRLKRTSARSAVLT